MHAESRLHARADSEAGLHTKPEAQAGLCAQSHSGAETPGGLKGQARSKSRTGKRHGQTGSSEPRPRKPKPSEPGPRKPRPSEPRPRKTGSREPRAHESRPHESRSGETGVEPVRQPETDVAGDRVGQSEPDVAGNGAGQSYVVDCHRRVVRHRSDHTARRVPGLVEDRRCLLSNETRGIPGREPGVVPRRKSGVVPGSEARVIRRSEAVLRGNRFLQPCDRVVGGKGQSGHRVGGHRGDLRGGDVDQSGVGEGLPGCGDEGLRGLFVAEKAQDVVDKRGHSSIPSIETVKFSAEVTGALP